MNNKHDIFLSYRREDGAEFCEGLANELFLSGYRVFFDKKSLRGGCDFPEDINEAIKESLEFIVIVTKSYFGKNKDGLLRILDSNDWCAKEIRIALKGKKNIFPILIDTKPPKANELPNDILKILDVNFVNYDRTIDTYSSIVNRIKNSFNEITNENAIVGHIIKKIECVDVNDNKQFNLACKEVMPLIKTDNDEKALMHILYGQRDKKYIYNNDNRFIVFYTLFSYYRRIRQVNKMIDLIDNCNNEFVKYTFYDYVLTEYYTNKFNLSENDLDEKRYISEALKHAEIAIEKIPENNGIIHSYCVTVALMMENNIEIEKEKLKKAIFLINLIIEKDKNYAMYYATKARLLVCLNKFAEALKCIRFAETLESAKNSDWIMRISNYNKIETLINIKKLNI